jgi:hypothetical protein
MNSCKVFTRLLLAACLLVTGSCSSTAITSSQTILVGSTPGDGEIKSLLGIPVDLKVDFIRWDLTLNNQDPGNKTFSLNIIFGENQPNTLGFTGGGQKRAFVGEYITNNISADQLQGEVYHLQGGKLPKGIKLVKLNENLFHILTSQNSLMIGNGGWSYTLNNKEPVQGDFPTPVLKTPTRDTTTQVIFDGRTPCQEFASEHEMSVNKSCFKLKWRIILNRDPVSHEPTTYTMRKVVDNGRQNVTGKWKVINGTTSNPNAVIYQLDPEDPGKSISLLVGDENVLFLLHKNKDLFVGNEDFSFTLNKKQEEVND